MSATTLQDENGDIFRREKRRCTVAAGLRAGVLLLGFVQETRNRTPARRPAATVIAAALEMSSIFRVGAALLELYQEAARAGGFEDAAEEQGCDREVQRVESQAKPKAPG
jgi:hypothetical protein